MATKSWLTAFSQKQTYACCWATLTFIIMQDTEAEEKAFCPPFAAKKQSSTTTLYASERQRPTGNLEDNPVHVDMTEAARLAKVDFILNVVENKKGEVVKAFAGDLSGLSWRP